MAIGCETAPVRRVRFVCFALLATAGLPAACAADNGCTDDVDALHELAGTTRPVTVTADEWATIEIDGVRFTTDAARPAILDRSRSLATVATIDGDDDTEYRAVVDLGEGSTIVYRTLGCE